MSFFNDWRAHYVVGYTIGLALHFVPVAKAKQKIVELDLWGWNRELEQNLKGKNPNDPMSDHQIEEAKAWGKGARDATGLNPPYPSPPYLV